ncbi:Bifunctional monothiol glutaredoxin-S16-chloroplastic [Striga hermonthica]|uniref:Bifunctional monothiol glutaredoxin-S16-chloroplastic n=1 Tax=Striga hermonthica TaxID=68872 RepID=A0A9N7NL38_STRHE|nr:Bifunctional monothiol glutaredoxin-S16-chloroplastic [Striga hermonthica]
MGQNAPRKKANVWLILGRYVQLTVPLESLIDQLIGKISGGFHQGFEGGPTNLVMGENAPRRKADLWLTLGRHVQLTVPLESLIDQLKGKIKWWFSSRVRGGTHSMGFFAEWWPSSRAKGVDYESVDVLDD